MRRRRLLALAAGALAGCGGREDATGDEAATRTATGGDRSFSYRAENPAENLAKPRGVRVENDAGGSRFLTVVVRDGTRTVVSLSREVPPEETRTFGGLVARRGIYDVVVETASGGRRAGGWVVHEAWPDLRVRLSPSGVTLEQVATCTPACPPLGLDGTATDISYGPGPGDASVGGTLHLRNASAETRRVAVSVDDGTETLLDYRYELPGRVGFALPIAGGPGVYPTRVVAGGATRRLRWHVPETPTLRLDVGPRGIRSRCVTPTGRVALAAENDDGRPRELSVRPRVDGRSLDARRYSLSAGAPPAVLERFPASESFGLEASTGTGEDLAARWAQCPPGELRLRVADGRLDLLRNYTVVATSAVG